MEKIIFEINPYNPFIVNSIKVGNKHTVIFHVGDTMFNNVNAKVINNFKEWINSNYDRNGSVKANRGKVHK